MRVALLVMLLLGCDDAADPVDSVDATPAVLDAGLIEDAASPPPDATIECPRNAPDCVPPAPPPSGSIGWDCAAGWSPVDAGVGCTPDEPPPIPDPEAGCADPWPPELLGTVWHVDPAAAADGADGSAGRPFATLADALAAARVAERPPHVLLLEDGEHVGDVYLDVPNLDLVGRCPAQVAIVGGLRLAAQRHRLAGMRLMATDDSPALVIEPDVEVEDGDPQILLDHIAVEGTVELANRVSAEHVSVDAASGVAVRLNANQQSAVLCHGCRIEALSGAAVVSEHRASRLDFVGQIRGGADDAPAVTMAGALVLTDSIVEANGATAIALTGSIEAERVFARARVAGATPDAAVLAFRPYQSANLLSMEDVVLDVPPGGTGVFICCDQNARFARWLISGPGDADSVGMLLHETWLYLDDFAFRRLGYGMQLRGCRGTLERAHLSDIARDGVVKTPLEGASMGARVTLSTLVADRIGGAVIRVMGQIIDPDSPTGRRSASVELTDGVIGWASRVSLGVSVESGCHAGVEATSFGPMTDTALTVDGGELEARSVVIHGAERAIVSRQGGRFIGEDLVVSGAAEALVADDAGLAVTRGLIADSVVGVIRRLAAAVTLRDVTFQGISQRDRCDLVCTDRPPNRGAPPPLPEDE